jgi:hypothetical protein
MALLYTLYPGFLWWIQGFEYQPMVLSATLQVFSIVFTLKAVQSQSASGRAWLLWIFLAVITGWGALAFVEYAIGMEVFRWLCVYLLISRNLPSWRQAIAATSRAASVTLLVPFGFLFWHQFIFENRRKAADLALQISALGSMPGAVLWWFIHFLQSLLNILVFVWVSPFNQNFFALRLRETLFAFGLMIAVLAIVFVLDRSIGTIKEEHPSSQTWQLDAIFIGLFGVGAGIVPIIIANRVVTFERFSHYALPASLAAVIFVMGLIYLIVEPRIRMAAVASLIGISVLTHSALALHARAEEKLIQEFWYQAIWRIPDLKTGTVLVVNYAGIDYQEGNDMVWGPANFIYYPERQKQIPVAISIAAARMEPDTPRNILEGAQISQNYIVVNDIQYDFDNLLVMTMPAENSCLHVLDENWAELSVVDTALIALAAPRSRIDNVVTDVEPHLPPSPIFGEEPAHEWCYYYQKALLARQLENWEEIAKIGNEVDNLGLHPNDQIEWMPFLQSAAFSGDEKLVKQISTRINSQLLYKQQACENLSAMQLTPEMQEQVNELFCGGRRN